jgi:hypothetical protein
VLPAGLTVLPALLTVLPAGLSVPVGSQPGGR